jgi:hypothetical protein
MSSVPSKMPDGFPLAPLDQSGQELKVGDVVKVISVESCARGLPQADQERLRTIVGDLRTVVEFDAYGFAWLSFTSKDREADFCLFPNEVCKEVAHDV